MHKSSATPAFLVQKMHDLLATQGWCQHHMAQDVNGTPCELEDRSVFYFGLVGAFYHVRDKYPQAARYDKEAIELILSAINKRITAEGKVKGLNDLAKESASKSDRWKYFFNRFNDEPGRTKMEVVRLLKEATEG